MANILKGIAVVVVAFVAYIILRIIKIIVDTVL